MLSSTANSSLFIASICCACCSPLTGSSPDEDDEEETEEDCDELREEDSAEPPPPSPNKSTESTALGGNFPLAEVDDDFPTAATCKGFVVVAAVLLCVAADAEARRAEQLTASRKRIIDCLWGSSEKRASTGLSHCS